MLSKLLGVCFHKDFRESKIRLGRTRWVLGLVAAVILSTLAAAVPAAAQSLPLYTCERQDNPLNTVDPLTGESLDFVLITVSGQFVESCHGLALHPTSGALFAVLGLTGVNGRVLVTVNPADGVATFIGNTGLRIATIAFDDAGTLYGITGRDDPNDPDTLFTIDTTSAIANLETTVTTPAAAASSSHALAFNDGLLYHSAGQSGTVNTDLILETIDPANAFAATQVTLMGPDDYGFSMALAHWSGDIFLVTALNNAYMIVVDPTGPTATVRFLTSFDHSVRGLAFAGTPPAELQVLYGAANDGPDGPSLFYAINPADGTPTLIGPTGVERMSAMAFDSTGVLWGSAERMDGSDDTIIVTIDPLTGLATEFADSDLGAVGGGTGGGPAVATDMSFDSLDELFAFVESDDELATVDLTTDPVEFTLLGTNVSSGGGALAFDPSDDTFVYQIDCSDLNTLDVTDGSVILATPLTGNSICINAMVFNPITGFLIGSDGGSCLGGGACPMDLVTIDTANAAVVALGPTQAGLDALALNSILADVEVTKVADPASNVNNGDTITYTVTVTNNGPSTANNVQVTDDVPAGITVDTVTPSVGACAGADPIICDIASLASAASATIVIEATVDDNTDLDNTASVTADETDPDTTNNTATTAVLAAITDLEITKEVDPATAIEGSAITYTLTVVNNGPDAATNVVVVDDLPADFTPDSASFVVGDPDAPTAEGDCDIVGSQVTCDLGGMAVAEEAVVEITGTVDATGDLDNTATVSADQADPNTADNTSAVVVTVGAFTVTLSPTSGSGTTTTFTATVTVTEGTVNDVELDCLVLSGPVVITCVFDPPTVDPGATSASSTLTVTAIANTGVASLGPVPPSSQPSAPLFAVWLGLPVLAFFGTLLFSGRRKRVALALALGLLVLALLPLAGCNNGDEDVTPPPATVTFAVRGLIGGSAVVSNSAVITVQ